jgi:hypothetical protein
MRLVLHPLIPYTRDGLKITVHAAVDEESIRRELLLPRGEKVGIMVTGKRGRRIIIITAS